MTDEAMRQACGKFINDLEMVIRNQDVDGVARLVILFALQQQAATWREAAMIAGHNFPFAATEVERLAWHQCVRIAAICEAKAKELEP